MSCKPKYGVQSTKARREQAAHGPYTKEELQAMLPKVGEHLMKKPSCSVSCQIEPMKEQPCVVVEVNEAHLWYRVQFDKTGICQCYKLPEVDYTGPRVGWDY